MLNAPTLEQLQALKLPAMATAWTEQQQQADMTALAFDERLALLVDAEWRARENKRLARALQEAKLKLSHACLEAIDYPARRELDKAIIRQLATCRWVEEHHGILINGMTGTGKSFLACALAHQACRKGYRVLYRRASRLFHELTLARADGTSSANSRAWTCCSSIHVEWSVMWSGRAPGARGAKIRARHSTLLTVVTAPPATRGSSRRGAMRDGATAR